MTPVPPVRPALPSHPRHHRLTRRARSSIAALTLLATAVAPTLSAPLASATAASPTYPSSLRPSRGAYFGSWVAPRRGETQPEAIRRVERRIGRRFAIDHEYYRWDEPIPTAQQRWDARTGRIPFVNWFAGRTDGSVVAWGAIASGAEDAWIRQRADAFKAFGKPVYLTFHHEPENDLSVHGTPADYAAAFRHVVDVFRSRGVTNVAFVWTMMSWTFDPRSGRDPIAYYPGDAYVDFVGSDGYNWYPGKAGARWASFKAIYRPTLDFARAHRKPVIAVEYGVQEDPRRPGRKARWFRNALAAVESWPRVEALIYFDEARTYPWISDSSRSAMRAYRRIANAPYLRAG
jgi:hypothetical protein